jgi:excisionase family DNA binding protein
MSKNPSPIAALISKQDVGEITGRASGFVSPGNGYNRPVGKRLLNAEEAAEYLGLSVDTVYKMARLRELPSVKVGRALRFDVEALDLYIKQHAIETIE